MGRSLEASSFLAVHWSDWYVIKTGSLSGRCSPSFGVNMYCVRRCLVLFIVIAGTVCFFGEACEPLNAPLIVSEYAADLRVTFIGADPLDLENVTISFEQSAVSFTIESTKAVTRLDIERTVYMRQNTCRPLPVNLVVPVIVSAQSFVSNGTNGLALNSTKTFNGEKCDVWASYISEDPVAEHDWDGLYICVRPGDNGMWIPVRSWEILGELIYTMEYTNVRPVSDAQVRDAMDIPDDCIDGVVSTLPFGVRDDFSSFDRYFWSQLLGTPDHFKYGAVDGTMLHLLVSPGDGSQNGGDGHGSERSEMLSVPMKSTVDGNSRMWFNWKFLLPESFPRDGNRLVMGQWKQSPLSQQSPIIAQRYNSSTEQLYWTVRNISTHCNSQSDNTVIGSVFLKRDVLHHVSFGIHWSTEDVEEAVVVILDGEQVGRFDGALLVDGDSTIITLLGMYRNAVPTTYEMYYADYEITSEPSQLVSRASTARATIV